MAHGEIQTVWREQQHDDAQDDDEQVLPLFEPTRREEPHQDVSHDRHTDPPQLLMKINAQLGGNQHDDAGDHWPQHISTARPSSVFIKPSGPFA
jgi:hypothetical protein